MFSKFSVILIMLLTLEECVLSSKYDRDKLGRKYPGFGKDWITMGKNEDGSYIIGYFKPSEGIRSSWFSPEPEEAVHFHLFTRDNSKVGKIYKKFHEVDNILDKTKPTKFIIHGWLSKSTAPKSVNLKDSLLRKYDANVFLVDWNKIGGNPAYPVAMKATKDVGEYVAKFVTHIIHDLGVDAKKIHILGHSLGAHVAGFTGRNVKNAKIGRVTGLDPALPGFENLFLAGGRLNKTDADFVDVIHTCSGFLGLPISVGDADFYPNGGSPPQPNCGVRDEMTEACSHGRSWVFYTKSINNPNIYPSTKCDSWENYEKNKCKGKSVPMGDAAPRDAKGNFYLHTDTLKNELTDQIAAWVKNG